MAYCTLADIRASRIPEDALIGLTDDDGLGAVSDPVVEQAIAEADELIDGYLRGRYEVPLAAAPGIVKRLSATIAAHLLYGRRPGFETPKRVAEDYAGAISTLRAIQRGDIQIGAGSVAEEAPGTLRVQAPAKMFDDDTWENY